MSELQCVARLKIHGGKLDRLPPVGALAADSRSGRNFVEAGSRSRARLPLFGCSQKTASRRTRTYNQEIKSLLLYH